MYDTVNFRLAAEDAGGADFLEEAPLYLERVGVHRYGDETIVTGKIGGLSVAASRTQVKVRDGSLCKWYLGDNFKTMGRHSTEEAIEKLSDALHLPMQKAAVTRLDVAQNFILRQPVDVYLNHLGEWARSKRLKQPNGLYYVRRDGLLCFYDKIREERAKGYFIPDMYRGRNVLRYEQRYTRRLPAWFNVPAVTAAMLYEETFYIRVVKAWRDNYRAINKINDTTLNIKAMKNKKDFYRMGALALIERAGGETAMLSLIDEIQKTGEITRQQAYDLRQAVKDVCKSDALTVENEAIKELTKKVNEAAMYYR